MAVLVPNRQWLLVAIAMMIMACQPIPARSVSVTLVSTYLPRTGAPGGQLTVASNGQVSDLNALTAASNAKTLATDTIFADLWRPDPVGRFVPDLVTEVPTVSDGLVKKVGSTGMDVTVKLKVGLAWSDGQPLTTADVIFTWQAICDPGTSAASTTGFDHIASMTVVSPTTMVWHFRPDPTGRRCGLTAPLANGMYPAYLTLGYAPMAPLPAHVLGRFPHSEWASLDYFLQRPAAVSGPYEVSAFQAGSPARLVLVPNPHYADGRGHGPALDHAPYLSQLTIDVYSDHGAELAALKSGQADIALDLGPPDLSGLAGVPGLAIKAVTGPAYEMVLFNTGPTLNCSGIGSACSGPILRDRGLREALSQAVDRPKMNRDLLEGLGRPLDCPFPSALQPWYSEAVCGGQPTAGVGLDRARSILSADGWKASPAGVLQKSGRLCEFRLSIPAGNAERSSEAEELISGWARIGCRVTADMENPGHLYGSYANGGMLATGSFQAALVAEDFPPDPSSWAALTNSADIPSAGNPDGGNWGRWADPTLDRLLAAGASDLNLSRRKAIYDEVQREWVAYAGAAQLYEWPDLVAARRTVGNLFPNAFPGGTAWNVADWYSAP